jgi:hypothetical protein
MRTVIAILILIACLIGSMIVINGKETNAGLPLVHASKPLGADIPEQNRLFAPCPIAPWALPTIQREHSA